MILDNILIISKIFKILLQDAINSKQQKTHNNGIIDLASIVANGKNLLLLDRNTKVGVV